MKGEASPSVWKTFTTIFVSVFAACTLLPLAVALAWAYSQYSTGIGTVLLVNVAWWLTGAALVALAVASAASASKRPKA